VNLFYRGYLVNSNWIESFINAADVSLENILLCEILISKKIKPDVLPEYFTGTRENFFNAIVKQWVELKCIDAVLLKKTYPENVLEAIALQGSSSPAIVDQLKTLWKKRELAKTICQAGEIENIDDILAKIQSDSGQITLKHSSTEYNHPQAMSDLLKALEHAQKKNLSIAGYSTGLIEMDKYLSGIEKGKTYFIGALKKSGKSRFAVYLSLKMKEAGAGVLWNSLEMNALQLNSCALAYYSDVDQRNFGRKMHSGDYSKILAMGIGPLSSLEWTISREKTVPNLRARILQEQNKKPIDVVIVDFIQRMTDASKENRAKEVESLAIGLSDLSRELNVAMIVLSQLTGTAEKLQDDEMPNMSHMKESQALAENADAIITLHNFDRRKNPFNQDNSYRLQEIYCLIEQRYDVSGCCFRFLGDLRTCNFKNHEDPYGGKQNDAG